MNECRCGAAAVFFDEDLVVFGEKRYFRSINRSSTLENFGFCQTYEKFAEKSLSWEIGENLHAYRSYFAAQTVEEKIYLIGSNHYHYQHSPSQSYNPVIGKTVIFSPFESKWNVAASLNDARAEFGCTVVRSNIYVFGGKGMSNCHSSSVEILHVDENLWTRVRFVSISGPMSACCLDERVYLVTGS